MDAREPHPDRGDPPRPRRHAPPTTAPSARSAPPSADIVTGHLVQCAHELHDLLESTRAVILAARASLPQSVNGAGALETDINDCLATLQDSLERMSALMRIAFSPYSRVRAALSEDRPLIDAVMHVCDALRPMADERNIRIELDFSPRLVLAVAGPIYTVLANAVRNAIESIDAGGSVEIVAELSTGADHEPTIEIDVLDDGKGPPKGPPDRPFDIGFTTKRTGVGVGLALSREIMRELGGWIELRPRWSDRTDRSGAHLMVRYPLAAVCETPDEA